MISAIIHIIILAVGITVAVLSPEEVEVPNEPPKKEQTK